MGGKSPCVSSVAKQALQPFKKLKPDTCPKGRYLPRDPTKSRLRALVEKELKRVEELWEQFESLLGEWKYRYQEAAERFIACGLIEKGFALFQCQDCGHSLKIPFSCKTRLCPSCARKRMVQWSDWLEDEVLLDLPGVIAVIQTAGDALTWVDNPPKWTF